MRKLAAGVTIAGLLLSAVPAVAAGGPSVTLSSLSSQAPTVTGDHPIVILATISTSTTWFNGGLIQVTNGSVSNFSGSGTTYTFEVTPSNPSDPDPNHRLITVSVPDNAFEGNNPSNALTFQFEMGASTTVPADTDAPVITITSGPAEGATSSTSSVMFEFTVDDASSTIACSIVGQDDADNFFGCGSPQTYTLPDGMYRFTVQATDTSSNTASTSRGFAVASATSTSTSTATSTPPDTGSGGGGGGGGGSTQTTSPSSAPVREGGVGTQPSGTPTGHAVIPTLGTTNESAGTNNSAPNTAGNAVIPTVPSEAPAPTVSQSSGGSALVPSNTPGVPDTGSSIAQADDGDVPEPVEEATTTTPGETYGIPTSSLGAAAATSQGGVPGWVWLVLAGLILIGVGVWALRQPA